MNKIDLMTKSECLRYGCSECGSDFISLDKKKYTLKPLDKGAKINESKYMLVICARCGTTFIVSDEEFVSGSILLVTENETLEIVKLDYVDVNKIRHSSR
ncbi:MAG: hypothetical protein RSB87_03875 [Clostridia bacterium]